MNTIFYKVTEERLAAFVHDALAEAIKQLREAGEAPVRARFAYGYVTEALCQVADMLGLDQHHEVGRLLCGLWHNGAWLRRRGATNPSNPRYDELMAALEREIFQREQRDDYFKHLSRTVFNCIVADIVYDESADSCGDCHGCDEK